jgi:hypothetical protein
MKLGNLPKYSVSPVVEKLFKYLEIENCGLTLLTSYKDVRIHSEGNQYGFVTAAHGVERSIDNKIYKGTGFKVVIGTKRALKHSGSVDASFIQIVFKIDALSYCIM